MLGEGGLGPPRLCLAAREFAATSNPQRSGGVHGPAEKQTRMHCVGTVMVTWWSKVTELMGSFGRSVTEEADGVDGMGHEHRMTIVMCRSATLFGRSETTAWKERRKEPLFCAKKGAT